MENSPQQISQSDCPPDSDQWKRIFDTMGDAVTLQDGNMHILHANKTACELLGCTEVELIGKSCYSVFRGIDKPCESCPGICPLKDNQCYLFEIEHSNLDKTFQVSASPVLNHTGELEYILHMARDVTRLKEIEERYRQAQKLEAVGRMAGGVAHNFNNILTGINGLAQLNLLSDSEESPCREDMKRVLALGRCGADLIKQLLAFSRQEKGERTACCLNHQIVDLFELLLVYLVGNTGTLTFRAGADLEKIIADPGQLEELVTNLVVNARDAIEKGGRIHIRTTMAVPDEEKKNMVMLEISDNGCGMDEATRSRIFEPFFTTKEMDKGSGLGLATVYGAVKQCNGIIQVESGRGEGTTFRIFFPIAKES